MTPSVSPISAQALNLLPIAALPVPSLANRGWLMRWRGDGQVYENKTGSGWVRLSDGSSAPITSIANDVPFTGNNPNFDTAKELQDALIAAQSLIATLEAKLAMWDSDGDGNIDPDKQQAFRHPQTTVSDIWTITHNLNRYPAILVRNNAGEPVTPSEVQYPTPNTTIITFGVPMSGTAEFI